jgi:hypothetical protein
LLLSSCILLPARSIPLLMFTTITFKKFSFIVFLSSRIWFFSNLCVKFLFFFSFLFLVLGLNPGPLSC